MVEISLGYSPCPNDTFIFHALVSGRLCVPGVRIREELHDVETLNRMAFRGLLDLSKLSFYAWLMVQDNYRLLSSGAALGYGCGPLLIARTPFSRDDMKACRVVLPGEWTTGHLLFRLWAPHADRRFFTTYDRIFDTLDRGEADCGVIIHESRFTYAQLGYTAVVDLGAWWEEETGLPVPLGCIAAHRRLAPEVIDRLEEAIRQSITATRQDPRPAMPYIRAYAQEMSEPVLSAHIDTFVNDFSIDLDDIGHRAIRVLEERADQAGIISGVGR